MSIFMSCGSNSHIDIQGHRGCRGLLPENSIPAFQKAIELGVHTLELDVVISKDHKVVVSHEPYMNSVICYDREGFEITSEKEKVYNLYKMDYEEIKMFDCGNKEHSEFPDQINKNVIKPLLDDVFELTNSLSSKVKFNIELKSHEAYDDIYAPKPSEFVRLVLEVVDRYNMNERTNLQSFDLRTLEAINQQDPQMMIALLVEEDEDLETKLAELSFKPKIISPNFKLLSSSLVKNLQLDGYRVIPWTVNLNDDLKRMIDYAVDGIITDYPDLLLKILSK